MAKFRTKARAVDLLGKGQIADLPTAICELWKNGYDAYAENLSCDLYLKGYEGLKKPLFTLSDDGYGMSRDDIVDKWIVLGTDSKIRGDDIPSAEKRFGREIRPQMGEKGIGRLSVSYLGSIMLMLTKAVGQPTQMLFFHWDILNNFNLFLDDLNIPITEFTDKNFFENKFADLTMEFKNNLLKGPWEEHKELAKNIKSDLNEITLPVFFNEEILPEFIGNDKHGTIFVIFDPHDQLTELSLGDHVEVKNNDASTRYLRSSLSGISNAFKGSIKLFNTNFRIHDSQGYYDFIAKENFFSAADMDDGDHRIRGSFDATGLFTGTVKVFNKTIRHSFRPVRPPGHTPYGPFKIDFW